MVDSTSDDSVCSTRNSSYRVHFPEAQSQIKRPETDEESCRVQKPINEQSARHFSTAVDVQAQEDACNQLFKPEENLDRFP